MVTGSGAKGCNIKTLCYYRPVMATNIKITKNDNEASSNVLRRFTRKVKGAGFIPDLKSRRYYTRTPSKLRVKLSALTRKTKTKEYQRLEKLGKIASRSSR